MKRIKYRPGVYAFEIEKKDIESGTTSYETLVADSTNADLLEIIEPYLDKDDQNQSDPECSQ